MSAPEYFQARSQIFRLARERATANFRCTGVYIAPTAQDFTEFAGGLQLPPLPFEHPRRSHLNPDPTEGRVPRSPSPDPNDLEYDSDRPPSNADPFGSPPIRNTVSSPPPYAEIPVNHPATVDQFRWSETPCPRRAQETPKAPLTPSLIKKEDIEEIRENLRQKRLGLIRLIARHKATITTRRIRQETPVRRSPRKTRYAGTYRY